ncbi:MULTISPECIES: hypothetical protein [unclassified Nocardia]|uniref:hypothetical protein n=1 Tax=unclassified Nocardia TaxID=2637762 RepID=UPI00278BFB0B|nr:MULTISPECIES: hypothetical protein [unclassified Nocardia]
MISAKTTANPAALFAVMLANARLAAFGFPVDVSASVMRYRAEADQKVRDIARLLTDDTIEAFTLAMHVAAWAHSKPFSTRPTGEQVEALKSELGL